MNHLTDSDRAEQEADARPSAHEALQMEHEQLIEAHDAALDRLDELTERIEKYDRLVVAMRSQVLLAANRIRAYNSPAYEDRHDYRQQRTLDSAYGDLLNAYNETAELLLHVRA